MRVLRTRREGVHNAVYVGLGKLVVVCDLDALIGGVNEQHLAVRLAFFQHHDTGGDRGAEKQIAGELNHAVHKVVVDEILANFLLRPAAIHDAGEADDGCRTIGGQPTEAVHDKGQIRLALRCQHASRGKTRIVYEQRVFIPCPLDGVGRIGDDQLKGFIVPMLGRNQGVLTGNIELVKADVMQEHIDAAKVVCGDIDFLTIKAIAHRVMPKDFFCL